MIENSKKKNEIVLFLDPTHQIHNNVNGYQWQNKGKTGTKKVLSNTGRKRITIIGAIELLTLKPTTIITESNCDKEMLVYFLNQVKKDYVKAKRIKIILDNATYNRAYSVQDEAKKLGIDLIYLPPYSPNLNLIERLWKFFKKKILINKYYQTFSEFYEVVIDFFRNFEEFIPELKTLLSCNFEII